MVINPAQSRSQGPFFIASSIESLYLFLIASASRPYLVSLDIDHAAHKRWGSIFRDRSYGCSSTIHNLLSFFCILANIHKGQDQARPWMGRWSNYRCSGQFNPKLSLTLTVLASLFHLRDLCQSGDHCGLRQAFLSTFRSPENRIGKIDVS